MAPATPTSSPYTLKLTIDRKFKDSVRAARKSSSSSSSSYQQQQQQQQQLMHVPCSPPVYDAPLTPESFYSSPSASASTSPVDMKHLNLKQEQPVFSQQQMYVTVSQQQQQQASYTQQQLQQAIYSQQQEQQQQQFACQLSDLDCLGLSDLLPLVPSTWSDLAYLDVCNKLTDSDISGFYGNAADAQQFDYAPSSSSSYLLTSSTDYDYSTPEVSEMMDAHWLDVALMSSLACQ
jgi:hypothetical protein